MWSYGSYFWNKSYTFHYDSQNLGGQTWPEVTFFGQCLAQKWLKCEIKVIFWYFATNQDLHLSNHLFLISNQVLVASRCHIYTFYATISNFSFPMHLAIYDWNFRLRQFFMFDFTTQFQQAQNERPITIFWTIMTQYVLFQRFSPQWWLAHSELQGPNRP